MSTPSDSPSDEPSDTGPATPPATGPMWSLGEAARNTGRAETTLRRALRAGLIPGAIFDPATERWAIPLAGLIAAGHLQKVSPTDPAGAEPELSPATTTEEPPTARDHELALEVAQLRAELAAARLLAEERARATEAALAHAADLRTALELLARALPAGPTEPASPAVTHEIPPRRRWWARGR